MFEIARLRDTVHIQPAEFGKPLLTVVRDALSDKYPNKVVPGLGLCIAIYDVCEVGESQLYPGSAEHHTLVEFRLVIFRPYVGEVLSGTIVSCDTQGVRLSLGFFDEIYVPSARLQQPSRWSEEERVWVWEVPGTSSQLFFDVQDPLRFRVEEVRFREPANEASAQNTRLLADEVVDGRRSAPTTPGHRAPTGATPNGASQSASAATAASTKTPSRQNDPSGAARALAAKKQQQPAMQIMASMDHAGLGLISWWPPEEDEMDEGGA